MFLLKLGISLLLIAFVVWKTGLNSSEGRKNLMVSLRGVDSLYFCLSLLSGIVLTTVSSWKWQTLLKSKGVDVHLARLVSFYFIGRFFNLFLPTSMGGDVVRVWEVGRHSGDKYEALASVFVERLTGMVTLALVAIVAVFFGLHRYDLPILTASLLFIAFLIFVVLWLILDTRILPLFSRLIGDRFGFTTTLFAKLSRIQLAIREYKDNPVVLLRVFGISCLFYFLAVVNVWVSARAFNQQVTFSSMLLAVPAIMLIMNLPVSIGGLGLMEAGYALLFPLFGYSPALALSTALLMRFKTLVNGGIGGVLHLSRLRGEKTSNRDNNKNKDGK